jgi:CRISPR-associated protein Csb2
MTAMTIAWEYLTGYAVATDPSSRDRAEWPPHPARMFMALAAALFETEAPDTDRRDREAWLAEREALQWLETLGDPEMVLPELERSFERSNVTFYVPVNDKAGPAKATLQSYPSLTRDRQARTIPRTWVGNRVCVLHWPDAAGEAERRAALARLCEKVTRIGHSSSLVAMRLLDPDEPFLEDGAWLVPEGLLAQLQARSVSPGTLEMLEERFGEEPRLRHAELGRQIEELKGARKTLKGKGASERKAEIDERIRNLDTERSAHVPRAPVRPVMAHTSGYRRAERGPIGPGAAQTLFDPDMLVLTQTGGPAIPLASTLAVTRALRETIMQQSGIQPAPSWVSGHTANGEPLRDDQGHLALVPLPFVGTEYADGHLLGAAIIFPRHVSFKQRGQVLGGLLVDPDGQARTVELTLGRLGVWELEKRDWQEPRRTLDPSEWTTFGRGDRPDGATTWGSVTPVVLDRFPKADRGNPDQRHVWEEEVRRTIGESCTRIGLPEPRLIDLDTTSWHRGSPRAIGKRRPLRGQAPTDVHPDAALGDGFPPYPSKGTNAPRPQLHVWLRFPRPVVGPVVLGAGRYLGYGLCKPLREVRS